MADDDRPAPRLPVVDSATLSAMMKAMAVTPGSEDDFTQKDFAFWTTQPVVQFSEAPGSSEGEPGPIEPAIPVSEVKQEPYTLPPGFEWCTCDTTDEATRLAIYKLLNENYVEDDDEMFRFDYSDAFLAYALRPPGYEKEWIVGVRVIKTQKLVGFITGVPAHVKAEGKTVRVAEINFLCVHKKIRDKRLAPVLIKEVTRRVHLTDTWQAVYTAGKVLPRPYATARYHHRNLNPKKLIEVGFSSLRANMTMARTIKYYKLPEQQTLAGWRPMEPRDVPRITVLLNEYLDRYLMHPGFSEEEVAHYFLPKTDIVNSYVIDPQIASAAGSGEPPASSEIKDFASFYTLNSTIIRHPKHNILRAAYAYYNVANTVSFHDLMYNNLIAAYNLQYDVFNCLELMENGGVVKDLKFGMGDGFLRYYMFNWRFAEKAGHIRGDQLGLVLM